MLGHNSKYINVRNFEDESDKHYSDVLDSTKFKRIRFSKIISIMYNYQFPLFRFTSLSQLIKHLNDEHNLQIISNHSILTVGNSLVVGNSKKK